MKTLILAAAAALGMMATPALAQDVRDDAAFTGPRVGATVGYDTIRGNEDVAYGGVAGYDFAYRGMLVGGEVGLEDSSVRINGVRASRDLAASARVGYVIAPRTMVFGKVGYATTRFEGFGGHTNLEGVRFGGGAEFALTPKTYLTGEYRRTEYEGNFGGRDQVMAGFGFRF
jgi:outer membrane immunogenic protein